MNFFEFLAQNHILVVVFTSWFTAQVLKTIINYLLTKEITLERLVGAGGMPSSHSALVCSLVVAIFNECGYASPEFAITLALASIVMYDAMGVRRAAGEQAKILNLLMDEFFHKLIKDELDPQTEELKELLGHTPLEVFAGAILGIVIAIIMK